MRSIPAMKPGGSETMRMVETATPRPVPKRALVRMAANISRRSANSRLPARG